ncbi:uncharacterized protein TNIN_376011 [Trichonephila inaurata madagascariensis]|uniref:Uncharacterized protein n=1 Tax=Trichonephila inaurata madagascariensis TaxID=2747483 RepID=A0A8X6XEZ5_9ARAC|nr:uncharacterized protein TNIN_376011 [Trichonephila inaurata madagascariensis]
MRFRRQRQDSMVRNSSTFLKGSAEENQLVVIGPSEVGKTALVRQYIEGNFIETHHPTTEENHIHIIKTPDEKFHAVNIKYTSVSMNYPAMLEHTVRIGRGFLLVFGLNNAQSFHEAIQLWEYIKTLRGKKINIFQAFI